MTLLHRIGWPLLLLMATCWCMPLQASAGVDTVDTISLERGCNGCADASVLLLQRDGTATLTLPGNARMGQADRVSHGRITTSAFESLARLAVAQGFFSLQDSYEDPTLRDGAWTTVGVKRGSQDKRVFVREDAAPANLKQLTAAIDQARGAIAFKP